MDRAEVLVIGEALIDIVRRSDGSQQEYPGGSPANVSLTLGRRGVRTELLTCIGDDERGATIRDWLDASHVSVLEGSAPRTSTAEATIGEDGSASYRFDIVWDPPGRPDHLHDLVHTGSIASYLEPGAQAVHDIVEARADGALVTYDPNVRPTLIERREPVLQRILAMVELADVVKVSDEDLEWIDPGVPAQTIAERWLGIGPKLVIVTAGKAGVTAFTPGLTVHAPTGDVVVADTICAGDSFMGATIDWLLRHDVRAAAGRERLVTGLDREALTDLLAVAARTADITVSRPGADPPWASELA